VLRRSGPGRYRGWDRAGDEAGGSGGGGTPRPTHSSQDTGPDTHTCVNSNPSHVNSCLRAHRITSSRSGMELLGSYHAQAGVQSTLG
jgi:hypothetical protein